MYACLFLSVLYPLSFSFLSSAQGQATIQLDPSQTFQTMTGWNAVAQIGQDACKGVDLYQEEVIRRAVSELRITRLQLEIFSGMENPIDYFAQYLEGLITFQEYRPHRYEMINDNADPVSLDPEGIHYSLLDHTIDQIILPYRNMLEANGEKLYLVLTYVDFEKGNPDHGQNPEEYAELILASFDHMQTKYGWVPDAIEVILEPDVAGWSPERVANALVAAGKRLADNGFTPDFLAPSTTSMENASKWIDEMVADPEVLDYLSEITYHRYSGVSAEALNAIVERANRYGLRTAMTEHIGSDTKDLHQDLKDGNNSAWSQYTLAFCTEDNGAQHYVIGNDQVPPSVTLGQRSTFFKQYFHFIHPGAVRIGASTNDPNFDPLAFINPDGNYVVVVKADQAGTFEIQGLPDGIYIPVYTAGKEIHVTQADTVVSDGRDLIARIPARGVITISWKGELVEPTALPTETVFPTETAVVATEALQGNDDSGSLLQPTAAIVQTGGTVFPTEPVSTPAIYLPSPGCTGRFLRLP
jgi:hypothetical protein